jgi:hypothetical protein
MKLAKALRLKNVGGATGCVANPVRIFNELFSKHLVQFKELNVGEFFIRVYSSDGSSDVCGRFILYQKVLVNHYVLNGHDQGDIRALNVVNGTDMYMHDSDMVLPVEASISIHPAGQPSSTGITGAT